MKSTWEWICADSGVVESSCVEADDIIPGAAAENTSLNTSTPSMIFDLQREMKKKMSHKHTLTEWPPLAGFVYLFRVLC